MKNLVRSACGLVAPSRQRLCRGFERRNKIWFKPLRAAELTQDAHQFVLLDPIVRVV